MPEMSGDTDAPNGEECHRDGGPSFVAHPAHELGDRSGRSPGLRVSARPGLPIADATVACPVSLTAHSCGGSRGFGCLKTRTAVPFSPPVRAEPKYARYFGKRLRSQWETVGNVAVGAPDEESSNALFDVLADWNDQLKDVKHHLEELDL